MDISGKVVAAGTVLLVVLTYLILAGAEGWIPFGPARPTAQAAPPASGKPLPIASSITSIATNAAPSYKPSSGTYTYSTPQPGPGCDKNGAVWTESNVQFNGNCALEATVQNQYGFLNFSLPNGRAFSQNNAVSITGSLGSSGDGYYSACLGLEENGSDEGYLTAYCNDGDWYIYTTTGEVIGHQIKTGSIPMGINGTPYEMTLALKKGMLSLTFNNVNAPGAFNVTAINVTSFEPTQIGIGYQYGTAQVPAPATDFVYTAQ
jgi:hypothetical protein